MSPLDYSSFVHDKRFSNKAFTGLVQVLREDGGRSLPDAEILSVVLGPDRGRGGREGARRVLEEAGWRALAAPAGPRPGWWALLTAGQAARLTAALELARRLHGPDFGPSPVLRTPREVYEATADLRPERREHFVGLYLNTRNRLLARETVSVGSLNASIVHPREVFEPALRRNAASLIVVHNHPSGEVEPSEDDIQITRRLAQAGDILGIALLDHVIVGGAGYLSLKEEGHL